MRLKELTQNLRFKLSSENVDFSGYKSQQKLSPEGRNKLVQVAKINYFPCGVMLYLFEDKNQEINIVLFQRQIHNGAAHSGQISFPGGKFEPQDKDLIETAIRETKEEIGVEVSREEVIGKLSSLKIPISAFELFPVIGYSLKEPKFTIETEEVNHLIFIKLKDLISAEIKKKEFSGSKYRSITAPYFEIDGYTIWGATAMILSEFRDLINP